ncbi:MAG: hypothetical protein ACUVQP_09035, partial [Bacteroidales bacterium]
IFPLAVLRNLKEFQKVFSSNNIKGQVFYAYKANKSVAVLKQLAVTDAKVDVASEKELKKALAAGFSGQRIEATGPKNQSFIKLALLHGVTLNVNSFEEFETIKQLKKNLNLKFPTPLFLRLKQFKSNMFETIAKDNKFGLNTKEVQKIITDLKNRSDINFIGFSFHLETTSEQERIIAIEQALDLTLQAIKNGLNPQGINIGGGFSLNFLKNKKEWYDYVSAIKESLLNPNKQSMSWNQSGLGFWAEKGKIRGSAKFSEFYRPINQFQELNKILTGKISRFGNFSQFLQENMLTLYIEPGRSLLDQAGVTLTKIISINKSAKGETVVFLDMNRSNMNSIELEFMADPIIISDKKYRKKTDEGVFLSGNLCLQHDLICRRKVFLGKQLESEDILAFINTAGYFMDFTESETIQHSIAPKIAINPQGWWLDENYEPILI